MNGSLPVYTPPGSYLGGESFHLQDVTFPPGNVPGSAKRASTYAWWQVGTAYVVPFVFDPLIRRQLKVFLPPQDRDLWWMFGDEIEAGERVGSMLVDCLGRQARFLVADDQRTRFLDLDKVWDLMRMITISPDGSPVPRHELARVFGLAMAPDEMPELAISGSDVDPASRWVDILSDAGLELVNSEMDPALQSILGHLTRRVLEFHGIPHK